jgi:Protein of unknown function (DUF4244)
MSEAKAHLGSHQEPTAAQTFRRSNMIQKFRARLGRLAHQLDAGMTTAEYAVGTVAAVGFALVLYKIVRSPAVASALTALIRSALSAHL